MLMGNMAEARTGVMEVPNMKPEALARFLEFVYTGAVEDVGEHLQQLLYAGDKYEVDGLVSAETCPGHSMSQVHMCSQHIDNIEVKPETATGILALVDRHNLTSIKQGVIQKILDKKDDYLADTMFLREMKSQPGLLVLLLAES